MKKWTPWILGSLTAFAVGACGGQPGNDGTADTGTQSGTMRSGATTDTAIPGTGATGTGSGVSGTASDTAHGGASMHDDSHTSPGAATGASDSARGK